MQLTKIEVSGINLTGTVSWARYWILEALGEMLHFGEIALQTCPISLEVKGERGDRFRNVFARGICEGIIFSGECRLCRNEDGKKFHIWHIIITLKDGTQRKFIPSSNSSDQDNINWERPYIYEKERIADTDVMTM